MIIMNRRDAKRGLPCIANMDDSSATSRSLPFGLNHKPVGGAIPVRGNTVRPWRHSLVLTSADPVGKKV